MKSYSYSKLQTFWLVVLRMLIGWHFLYEGIIKVLNPKWTAFGYLMDSQGCFQSLFHSIAENKGILSVVNICNEWGLILIGLGLIAGCLSRIASIGGIVLLAFYYLSHPSFIGASYMMPSEGSYLWVDKNLIEIAALAVIYILPTSRIVGLDRFLFRSKNQ